MKSFFLLILFFTIFSTTIYARDPFFEGLELLDKGEYQNAASFFERALKENKEHAPTYSRLAECYEHLGKYREALPYWKAYMERKIILRDDITNHIELLKKLEAAEKLLSSKSDESEIIKLLTEITKDRYRGSVIACKANLLLLPIYYKKENYSASLDIIKTLIKNYPKEYNPDIGLTHGICLRKVGNPSKSVVILRKHLNSIKSPADLRLLVDKKAWEDKVCREITFSLMDLALRMAGIGKFEFAEKILKEEVPQYQHLFTPEEWSKVEKLDTKIKTIYIKFLLKKGTDYFDRSNYKKADLYFKKAEEKSEEVKWLKPYVKRASNKIYLKYNSDLAIASKYIKSNRDSAIAILQKMSNSYPANYSFEAARTAARLCEAFSNYKKGINILADFVENFYKEKESYDALYQIAVTLDAHDNKKEAVLAFKQLASFDDEYAKKLSMLGCGIMLFRDKKKSEAINLLTQAAVKYKDDPEYIKKVKKAIFRMKECSEFHPPR